MLRELHIHNLAVIEDATLELGEGLNCFTGQTGAGKSLVLGAFGLLLGLKSAGGGADMIRAGASEAQVNGLFDIEDQAAADDLSGMLDETLVVGDELLITRKLFASGRSSTSVNGRPATAAMVRRIGQRLVDIHGQHDLQHLLRPSAQLAILDRVAGAQDAARACASQRRELRELIEQRARLLASSTLRRQQLELYEFQAQEIDAAGLVEGEFAELQARHRLLSNLTQVQGHTSQAYAALYDSEGAIIERVQMVVHLLDEMTRHDEALEPIVETLRSAALSLQEGAFDLSRYNGRLELDPAELRDIEDRLNTVNRLVAKYGQADARGREDPCEAVLDYRRQIEDEIERLRRETSDLTAMDQRLAAARAELARQGEALSAVRRKTAASLKPRIEAQLRELGMADARFDVAFEPIDDPLMEQADKPDEGADAEDADDAGTAGLGSVEFMIRPNPGQPARPLRKIASGGELSRVTLALKAILAGGDRVSVLVFDEIDANIGGRLGAVIGAKLRTLAAGGHQVLCITHLPQIAAYAHRHLRIAKQVRGGGKGRSTVTTVEAIDGDRRIEELAEMLAGGAATDTTRQQVIEMLASAG